MWAVKEPDKEFDELTSLFENGTMRIIYWIFQRQHRRPKEVFPYRKVSEAIRDTFEDADELEELILEFPYTENLDGLFMPLDVTDARCVELTRRKARNWNRDKHASWLRIYAIRLEANVYVVTGGAIKLTHLMQDKEHTAMELDKLNRCKAFLKANGVFDKDSFVDLNKED